MKQGETHCSPNFIDITMRMLSDLTLEVLEKPVDASGEPPPATCVTTPGLWVLGINNTYISNILLSFDVRTAV